MKVLLKLYSTEDYAADGSRIPRKSTEEYLQSDDYQLIIRDKIAIGGVTHKDRRLSPEYKGIVGCDDQVLINDNATHYFTKIFMKGPEDPFVYGEIEFFDPDLFTGKRRDNILNMMGLVKSGVKVPVSIVIHALWDTLNVAQKIIRIKGVDWTMNNSFPNAGPVKAYSDCEQTQSIGNVELVKEYSIPEAYVNTHQDCRCFTKIFSAEVVNVEVGDIQPLNELADETVTLPQEVLTDESLTRDQIIRTYGRNSYEALATKSFAIISKSQLEKLVSELKEEDPKRLTIALGEEKVDIPIDADIEEIQAALNEIIKTDDPNFIQNVFKNNRNKFLQMLVSVPKDDPNRKQILVDQLNEYFRNVPDLAVYSTINSVKDRMFIAHYPRFSLINRLLKTYKNYWDQNNSSMDESEVRLFESLVIQDINLLLRQVDSRIMDGSNLTTIYGLAQFGSKGILDSASDLSKSYRQILLAEQILGFIPQNKYTYWKTTLKAFYRSILSWIEGKEVDPSMSLIDQSI